MKKYLCLISVLGVLLYNTVRSYAQKVAVKTNLLYDATTTMKPGAEMSMSKRNGLSTYPEIITPGSLMMKRACATGACSRNFATGWWRNSTVANFLALHGHYAKYNVGGMSFLSDNMERHRYQGHLWGGGISYGYQWLLGNRWSMEAVLGVGYARLDHSKYPCATCGTIQKSEKKNYFGPTKAAVSIIYIIK